MARAAGVEVRINRPVFTTTSLHQELSHRESPDESGGEEGPADVEGIQEMRVEHLGSDLDQDSEAAASSERLENLESQDSVSKQLFSEMGVTKLAVTHPDHVEPAATAPEAPSGQRPDEHATASESASLLNSLRSIRKHPAPASASASTPLTNPAQRNPQRSTSPAPQETTGAALFLKATMLQTSSLASLRLNSSRAGTLRRPKYIFENMTKRAPAPAAERADPYAIADSPVKDLPSYPQMDDQLSRVSAQNKRKAKAVLRADDGDGPRKRERRGPGVSVAPNPPHTDRSMGQQGQGQGQQAERAGGRIMRSTVSKRAEGEHEDISTRRAHKGRDNSRPNTAKKTDRGHAAREQSVPRAADQVLNPKRQAESINDRTKVDSHNLRFAKNMETSEGHEQLQKRGRPLESKARRNRQALRNRQEEVPSHPRALRSEFMSPSAAPTSKSAENSPEASPRLTDGAKESKKHPTAQPEALRDNQESDKGDASEAPSNVVQKRCPSEVSENRGIAKSSADDAQASSRVANAGINAVEKRANRAFIKTSTPYQITDKAHGHVDNDEEDETQLHGQKNRLKDIYEASRKIGRHKVRQHTVIDKPKLQTEAVKTLKNLCSETRQLYVIMLDIDNKEELNLAREKSEDLLVRIADSIASLVDDDSDDDPKDLIQDIYAHALPSLIRLLEATAAYHGSDGTLTGSDLQLITRLIHLILTLGAKARAAKDQPRNLGLVKPSINGILVPLSKVHTAFTEARKIENEAKTAAEAAVQARRREKERRKREELEQRVCDEKNWVRKRWQELHLARMKAERDPRRRGHLRYVPPPCATRGRVGHWRKGGDVDANGVPFDRVEVFMQRRGGTVPTLLEEEADEDEDEEDVWSTEEVVALLAGLEIYAGPDVYECIFAAHCGPGGPLRRFSVPQITRKAKYLKDTMMQVDAVKGKETDGWVEGIPVFEV